ncbi:hypothetical protein B2G71_18480 [Novosphingobium sp. PC22D]|uniref:hypothetical protein n=1 Tax=Novosphingobium sp. PC22D TaxID=1962403 RepID=UPI000BF196CF|nr:hypothetical protein [Novosphingobium sp. PC22D]PEQ11272.1 hypothetical protein B2G71_18480 [Novosphingobium sp. PC22D]
MTGNTIGAIVALAACLVLAIGGLRAHRLTPRRTMMFAAAWAAIIIALMLIVQAFGISVR